MDGIDRITARIRNDAEVESAEAIARAESEVKEMLNGYDQEAVRRAEEVTRRSALQADLHHKRREAVAELEARKEVLAAKQEMLDIVFARVPRAIYKLPDRGYIDYLAKLAVQHSRTGKEQILLSKRDLDEHGAAVLPAINALLAAEGKKTGMTLSDETVEIAGGLILRDGDIEVNCAIETLLHFIREELSGEVAEILFD